MWLDLLNLMPAHVTSGPTSQDSGWVFWATCVAIALMFLWGKLASYLHGQTGVISSLPEGSAGCRPETISIAVELWSGRKETAKVDGCLACSLGLAPGDRVWLAKGADGYLVIRAKGRSLRRLLRETAFDSSRECLLKRES